MLMTKSNFIIPMIDKHKTLLIQAIMDAIKKDIIDFRMENHLETFISIHLLKWDFINKNIIRAIRKLSLENYQCVIIKRGSLWEQVLIYDKETGFLYTLMNEKRFFQLSVRPSKQSVHYLDGLAFINSDLEPIESGEQLSLFEFDNSAWNEKVNNVLKSMVHMLGEIKRFVLITFKTEKGEVTSVNTYMPTADLGIAYSENWDEFITADFSVALTREDFIQNEQEEEIIIDLQDGVIPHQEDNEVQLRDDEQEKDG